jgi:hypothetical protein
VLYLSLELGSVKPSTVTLSYWIENGTISKFVRQKKEMEKSNNRVEYDGQDLENTERSFWLLLLGEIAQVK